MNTAHCAGLSFYIFEPTASAREATRGRGFRFVAITFGKNEIMDKQLALESLQFRIRRVSEWRRQQAERWPDDNRNERAAVKLDALSRADTDTVTPEQWLVIQPLMKLGNFNELVDDAARAVEFRAKCETLSSFVSLILSRYESRRKDYEARHAA